MSYSFLQVPQLVSIVYHINIQLSKHQKKKFFLIPYTLDPTQLFNDLALQKQTIF
jgi:hypothetical protein